jgi:formylglycine-generating enzyme required for sulfatase activity
MVLDFYSADYYKTSPTIDPTGPDLGDRHISRGGSWNDGNFFCRAANRFYPDSSIQSTGFRIVRNVINK